MVRSKLAAAILSASLALPGVASALGIGDYTLKSYLNQPLELEIGLVQTRDLSTEEVIASLAAQAEFDRAGVERLFFLSDMRFEIRQNTDGTMSVVARTSKPVTEPFLNFLVEVQWPQGRMLREYTILLDPPVYKSGAAATATAAPVSESSAPAAAPVVSAPVPPPTPASVYVPPPAPVADSSLPPPPTAARQQASAAPRPQPVPQADAQPAPAAAAGPGEYQVQSSDTMWDIAARNRAGSASVQQTMMAIQRANPDAFIRGNVNLIKKGYVLRIPGEAESLEVGTADASRQFSDQTRVWRELLDQRAQALPSDDAQLQGAGAARPAAPAAKGSGAGEVTLVAPAAAGGTKGSGGKDAAALQNKLAIAEEGLDKAARENKELASRLADLDKQVKGSEKLLAMKNDEIATLQAELNKIRKEKGLKPEPEPAKAPAVVEEEKPAPVAETEAVAGQSPEQPAKAEKPVTEKAAKAEKTAKVPKKEEKGSSLLLPVAGLLVLLGAGGAGFWFWRKKKSAAPAAVGQVESEEAHDAEIADDLAQLQDLNLASGGDDSQVAPAGDSEAADPMGEADMYMAYGRFQQAADILYAALQREPERGDFRVKLAEVYAEMGDYDAAREQASLAAGDGSAPVRAQASSLLAKLGGAAAATVASTAAAEESMPSLDDLAMEFAGGHDQSAQSAADGLDSLDLDLEAADSVTAGDDLGSAGIRADSSAEESLDFSLDDMELPSDDGASLDGSLVTGSQTAVPPGEELSDEFSLDDADFGEFTLDEEAPAQAATAPAEDVSLDLSSDEFSLDNDFSFDESALQKAEDSAPEAQAFADESSLEDELSLDDADLDFSAEAPTEVMAAVPDFDEHETVRTEAVQADDVTAVQPAADLDLESELADLQSDLSGEGVSATDAKGGDDFDFLADSDENATKLDLAKAYIDMGDAEGARDILNEVVADGSDAQKAEASRLLAQVG
jgi:pilus assembly protein FimV